MTGQRLGIPRGTRGALLMVILGLGLFVYVWLVEPNWIVVTHVQVRHDRLAQAMGATRLLQLSDLHLERYGMRERHMVRVVNRQRPDWVVITGDLINGAEGWPSALQVLHDLRATQGVWVVPGNTDNHFLTPRQFDEGLSAIGVRVLRNAAASMGETGVWLVGVDDPVFERDALPSAMQGLPARDPAVPVILLAHAPEILPDAVDAHIPLVLVGHTHGGQCGIAWLRRFFRYADRGPYVSGGLYQVGPVSLYVNRGIGTKKLPYRFLAPPEVTVVQLVPAGRRLPGVRRAELP